MRRGRSQGPAPTLPLRLDQVASVDVPEAPEQTVEQRCESTRPGRSQEAVSWKVRLG